MSKILDDLRINKNAMIITVSTGLLCNLNCHYCFDMTFPKTRYQREILNVKNIINFADSLNRPVIFHLVGGEPFLAKNIFKFIIESTQKGYYILINTNFTVSLNPLIGNADFSKIEIVASLHFKELKMRNLEQKYIDNYNLVKAQNPLKLISQPVAHPSYTEKDLALLNKFWREDNGIDYTFNIYSGFYQERQYPMDYLKREKVKFGLSESSCQMYCESSDFCTAGVDLLYIQGEAIFPCTSLFYDSLNNFATKIKYNLGTITENYNSCVVGQCPLKECGCPDIKPKIKK